MGIQIVKRVLFTVLITLVVSVGYAFISYRSVRGFEEKQGQFLLVILNAGLSLLNGILALPGLLNLNANIRNNFLASALCFFTLPVALLLLLMSAFASSGYTDNISEFLTAGMPSVIFCMTLAYHFYRFRRTVDVE